MATLKDHQQAMVDLLASGSGIPASAMRLAHAMHDLINVLYVAFPNLPQTKDEDWINGRETRLVLTPEVELNIKDIIRAVEANSPGLNDKAISKREKPVKTESPAKWPTSAERRVKELENTCKQLRYNLRVERIKVQQLEAAYEEAMRPKLPPLPEQAGVRKDDTQECEHHWRTVPYSFGNETYSKCDKCGAIEQ